MDLMEKSINNGLVS